MELLVTLAVIGLVLSLVDLAVQRQSAAPSRHAIAEGTARDSAVNAGEPRSVQVVTDTDVVEVTTLPNGEILRRQFKTRGGQGYVVPSY